MSANPDLVLRRSDVLEELALVLSVDDLVIALPSTRRQFRETAKRLNPEEAGLGDDNAFAPTILGSISSTALGLAVALPDRRIVSLETDGSMLMNTGIMCTLGAERPGNLTVVVLDNGVYESIGGMPTHTSRNTDLARMAEGAGCINCSTVRDRSQLTAESDRLLNDDEFGFLVAKIGSGRFPPEWRRHGLREDRDGVEDKYRFMRHIERLEGTSIQDVRFW